ncbi:MAG TPA: glycoside hydrolase family 20 zincin-like fold domain-containing protein [Phototrophicaceae bacterium]|nr:glycoside hydrolase family 20 zincin-like fold domain-containing protein [Phototrophicaceae bacterium]
MPSEWNLIPLPRTITTSGGTLDLQGSLIALVADPAAALRFTGLQAQAALKHYADLECELVAGANDAALLSISFGGGQPEGYHLSIRGDGIRIVGSDPAGAFYGVQTLKQLLKTHGAKLPLLEIDDSPDFQARGVMLDISRDKVPTMETLYELIDRLASLKINQLQLYTEHTFAYRKHPVVWAKASPITSEEILALDAYCRERFIDLVPNQNSFGHMWRWLQHPEYADLAETHERVYEWMSEVPFTLDPSHPGSLRLLESLYDELLPNFTNRMFNVGADETWDLGTGRSKALVTAKGKGRVYLDFVLEIYKRVTERGRTMQFWGDIINQYPDLVPEIPKDVIALEWGYEAEHPFEEKSALFARSGVPFYVCPGTSAWNTIGGRTDNMIGNIRSAVENGLKYGAMGVLNTDWGDRGHWQQTPISYPGFAYGAALSWNHADESDLSAALNTFVFDDEANVLGKLAYDLGNAYEKPEVLIHNASFLFWIYSTSLADMRSSSWHREFYGNGAEILSNNSLLLENLHDAMDYIDQVMQPLDQAQITRPDADLIKREYQQAAHMLKHGAQRALLEIGDDSVNKAELLADMDALIAEQKALWLARNRSGGLDDSLARLEQARQRYT